MPSFDGIDVYESTPEEDGPRYYFLNQDAIRYALTELGIDPSSGKQWSVDRDEFMAKLFEWVRKQKESDA